MRWKELVEAILYRGDFTAPYAHQPVDLTVLKNPSRGEMKRLFANARIDPYTAGGKELRGILSDDLYVWDAGLASHDDIKKTFQLSGMHVYFYPGEMKMDDYLLRDPDMKQEAIDAIMASDVVLRAMGRVTPQSGPNGFSFTQVQ